MSETPWQIGNVPGPTIARTLESKTFTRLMSKPSAFIIGTKVGEEGEEGDFLRKMTKILSSKGIPIFASPSSEKIIVDQLGIPVKKAMNLPVLTKKFAKEDWENLGCQVETLAIGGFLYYFQSQALAAIRNNSAKLKTISIDPYFSPNASYSSPSIVSRKLSEWYGEMIAAAENIK
ncbi:MAG: carbon monoxide dehydrogenase beta subunit family protein [Candidatus Hodarchaeales archaeon]